MDEAQKNHLKAYGIAYWALKGELEIHWLLNYRGGSFMIPNVKAVANECLIRGVSYEVISDAQGSMISPPLSVDLAIPEAGGQFARTIIKTADPDRYGVTVGDYLT